MYVKLKIYVLNLQVLKIAFREIHTCDLNHEQTQRNAAGNEILRPPSLASESFLQHALEICLTCGL